MGNAQGSEDFEELRNWLLQEISQSNQGEKRLKIKTLLGLFGFTATRRLRQSSLAEVLETLECWGVEYRLPETPSIDDRIFLSRPRASEAVASSEMTSVPVLSTRTPTEVVFEGLSPFSFAFQVEESLDDERSRSFALDLQNSIWSFRPVFLVIEGGEEFFSLACGFLSAVLRRRNLALPSWEDREYIPGSPDIITSERLRSTLGIRSDPNPRGEFPQKGAVYLLKVQSENAEDDDLVASVRECLIPHTYRIRSRFSTTSQDPGDGSRAVDAPDFNKVLEWLAAFTGTTALQRPPSANLLDLATLMAESSHIRDILEDRRALSLRDLEFRSGHESLEHMLLKDSVIKALRSHYPDKTVRVEEKVGDFSEDDEGDFELSESGRGARPDVRVEKAVWVEVETLRGISAGLRSPFFDLETKLRRKLGKMGSTDQVWLMLPSDVALLAPDQVAAIVHNLNQALGAEKIRAGFVDLLSHTPIFLPAKPLQAREYRLVGASWHPGRRRAERRKLTWTDVAGYNGLKERVKGDLLDALVHPERYSRHGLTAANGLLLYGLPGCGKSLVGRVLADEVDLVSRFVSPSDITSMWLGEGVIKIRELFDWALRNAPCMLILDELDGVAPRRQEGNMHTDEKRQVNELLAQLDRINDKGVVVVATTNYFKGIDTAVQRSGRFDVKLPVFPPQLGDREDIFRYYLSPERLRGFEGLHTIDTQKLGQDAVLFSPADIKVVVQMAARRARRLTEANAPPGLATEAILAAMKEHPRSIRFDMALEWLAEAEQDLHANDPDLVWLRDEIEMASQAEQAACV